MGDGMIFLYLLVIAVVLSINYIIAKQFENIAYDKGYNSDAHPFAMCFWFGIIGYIYVAAMPKLTSEEMEQKEKEDEIEAIYREANEKINNSHEDAENSITYLEEAIELLSSIVDYKDSRELIEESKAKIEEMSQ